MVRRIILIVISLAFGFVVTTAVTIAIGTTPAEYGLIYYVTTALALAVALAVWLDKFLGTRILPK